MLLPLNTRGVAGRVVMCHRRRITRPRRLLELSLVGRHEKLQQPVVCHVVRALNPLLNALFRNLFKFRRPSSGFLEGGSTG